MGQRTVGSSKGKPRRTVEPAEGAEHLVGRPRGPEMKGDEKLWAGIEMISRGLRVAATCTHKSKRVANELSSDGPVGGNAVALPGERAERGYRRQGSEVDRFTHALQKILTVRHEQAEVVGRFPVAESILDGLAQQGQVSFRRSRDRTGPKSTYLALGLVVVVLKEVSNDPLLLALRLERQAEPERVEQAPREGVDESEGDLHLGSEGGEHYTEDGVERYERKGEVAVAIRRAHFESARRSVARISAHTSSPEDVKVLKDEQVMLEIAVVEIVARGRGGRRRLQPAQATRAKRPGRLVCPGR